MQSFVYIAYAIILLILATLGSFILFHLIKYSINSETSRIAVISFSVVSGILVLANIFFFFSIDWIDVVGRIGFTY